MLKEDISLQFLLIKTMLQDWLLASMTISIKMQYNRENKINTSFTHHVDTFKPSLNSASTRVGVPAKVPVNSPCPC